jgi:uncharacterized protein YcfJ
MLDSILNTAKDYIQDAVVNHADVPNQQNSMVSDVILNTLGGALKNQLGGQGSGINLSQLGSLLGGGHNSGFYNNAHNLVVDALTQKAGLNPQVAQSVASAVLPGVVSVITKQIGSKAGGNVLGKLAGGLLGNLFGK